LSLEYARVGGSAQIFHADGPAIASAVQRRKNSPQRDFGFLKLYFQERNLD